MAGHLVGLEPIATGMSGLAVVVAMLAALAQWNTMVDLESVLANPLSADSALPVMYAIQLASTHFFNERTKLHCSLFA